MCGRYSLHRSWEEMRRLYNLIEPVDISRNVPARYNIAPSQDVLTVRLEEGVERVHEMTWGLVPFWAKEDFKNPQINARGETVKDKPMFRQAFKSKRCLLPADGYYEWTGPKGSKQPYHLHLNGEGFSFAGIWAQNDNLGVTSCAIITLPAADQIAHIHNRMPVILTPDTYAQWLDPETSADQAQDALSANEGQRLTFHLVDKAVGNVKTQGAACVEPI